MSSSYKLLWNVSQITKDEDKLQMMVHKDNIETVSKLKQVCLTYDENYPNSDALHRKVFY